SMVRSLIAVKTPPFGVANRLLTFRSSIAGPAMWERTLGQRRLGGNCCERLRQFWSFWSLPVRLPSGYYEVGGENPAQPGVTHPGVAGGGDRRRLADRCR